MQSRALRDHVARIRSESEKRVFQLIRQAPRASVRQIAALAGMSIQAVSHVLNRLEAQGSIMTRYEGGRRMAFIPEAKEAVPHALAAQNIDLGLLRVILSKYGPLSQREVIEAMAAHGWARSTTQH